MTIVATAPALAVAEEVFPAETNTDPSVAAESNDVVVVDASESGDIALSSARNEFNFSPQPPKSVSKSKSEESKGAVEAPVEEAADVKGKGDAVAEEPAAEPAVEEAVAEERAVEEPAADPAIVEAVAEEPVVEEPAADPAVVEAVVEEPPKLAGHFTLSLPESLRTPVDNERPRSNGIVVSSRYVVLKAQETNQNAGHENKGYLSFSHGFAPRLTPMTHFPPEFDIWNKLCADVPSLLSSNKLRQYCDDLPVLDAKKLPPAFALRAANVLGYTAHAYWNIGEVPEKRSLPPGLEVPWKEINHFHLGRDGEAYLGFFELIVGNFQFDDGAVPTPPVNSKACPWATKELATYGSIDYDPTKSTISNFSPSFWLTGLKEERIFYGVMTEMHTIGAPIVKLTVEAQEAVLANNAVQLKCVLQSLLQMLTTLTFNSFNKIQQQRMAPHYNDATLWCKVVAPIATPITSTTFGPSGTACPLIHVLDAFFGRTKHEKFIGKEVQGLLHSFPTHWKEFVLSVWHGPSIRKYVANKSDDSELQGLFGAALQQYAGENGFLGRHKLKMVGYLEVAMKLGRAVTLGGFAGLLKDRTWDKIADELKIGQDERFAGVGSNLQVNVGTIITPGEVTGSSHSAHCVRINIKGSGICYEAGSHIGVLYESSNHEVFKTLMAFTDGDANMASEIGEEFMVKLNPMWRQALRARQEYHNSEPPTHLKLSTFLKYAALRPATRQMLKIAYDATLSDDLHSIMNKGLEAAITFSDIVTIMGREGVDLLSQSCGGNAERRQRSLQRASSMRSLRKASSMRQVSVLRSRGLIKQKAMRGMRLPALEEGSRSDTEDEDEEVDQSKEAKTIPNLCKILEPAGFRLYSIASSPKVFSSELHLYVQHVKYHSKSAVVKTSPLLAGDHKLVEQHGAASDYLVSRSLPRYHLAVDFLKKEIGFVEEKSIALENACSKILEAKELAHINDEEMGSIMNKIKASSNSSGNVSVAGIMMITEQELKGKRDPREKSVVLMSHSSPRFRLPNKTDVSPCIMIAGGTGLAPFRSFWQELAQFGKLPHNQKHLLLIQQRSRNTMAFEDEILALIHDGIMDVRVMFSRDDCVPIFEDNKISYKDLPGRSGYIDKLIVEESMQDRISSMIHDHSGYVYICGRGSLAKTAVDALELCLSNVYGDEAGQIVLERMVAENRLVLDIFTSLSAPPQREFIDYSQLCQCNDFSGVRTGTDEKSKSLFLVINSVVYDMNRLFSLHPGGDIMLKLYCGMDATKAWEAVKHDKAPEVAAMLEMFDAGMTLREIGSGLTASEKIWYESGWKEMTMLLVEMQNAISLAFERNWDNGSFSSAEEEQKGAHFTVWEGKATWRPKRSILKGSFFIDTHNRLWSVFLPVLLSGPFDEIQTVPNYASKSFLMVETAQIISQIIESREHSICDSVCTLMKEELKRHSSGMFLSTSLQAYMEEVRKLDDALLEDIKARLVTGLRVFEGTPKSPLLPLYSQAFEQSIKGILEDVRSYIDRISSLTRTAFGCDRVYSALTDPDLKEGGLALLHSSSLGTVSRDLLDLDEAQEKVLGGDVNVDHKVIKNMVCPHTG